MNAIDQQCWKFTEEFKRAKASGKTFNCREVAGSFLASFTLAEASEAARKALAAVPDPVLAEAVQLLEKLIVKLAVITAPRPAGEAQVSTPSPAEALGGANL